MTIHKVILCFMVTALLTACGGGGSSPADTGVGGSGGGTGQSGRVVGPFQGPGSIIVNDRTLTTAGALFEIEEGSSESDLREGQQLLVFADLTSNEAKRVIYRSDVKGPLTSLAVVDPLTATAQLRVLGQPVLTNAATRFDGVSLSTLAVGAELEVSGNRNADGVLVATYIGLEAGQSEFKVIGLIESLDPNAMTFAVQELLVDYSSATLSEFSGAAIANGQRVEVRLAASDFSSPANALAREIELLTEVAFEDGEEIEIEGFVNRFVSPTNFDVDNLLVSTNASTSYVNGNEGSLGLNVKIEAEGNIDSSGRLLADRIVLKPTAAIRVEGTLSSINENASTVMTEVGLTFEVRSLTEVEDDRDGVEPFGLADLQAGDYVELRGFLDGQVLVAGELERDDFDTRTRLRGPVTAEDEAAGTLQILDVAVIGVAGTTSYDTTQAQFHAEVEIGSFVEAEWDPFVSTDEPANNLSVEDD